MCYPYTHLLVQLLVLPCIWNQWLYEGKKSNELFLLPPAHMHSPGSYCHLQRLLFPFGKFLKVSWTQRYSFKGVAKADRGRGTVYSIRHNVVIPRLILQPLPMSMFFRLSFLVFLVCSASKVSNIFICNSRFHQVGNFLNQNIHNMSFTYFSTDIQKVLSFDICKLTVFITFQKIC